MARFMGVRSRALYPFKDIYVGISESLSAASNFLISRRDASGAWKTNQESAQSLLALTLMTSDLSSVRISAESLAAKQGVDGSWGNDVFTTAVALRALWGYQSRSSGANSVAGTGTITGYAVKAGTGEGIANVEISLTSSIGTSVYTGADGYFVMTGVNPGHQTITAQKPGYAGVNSIINVYSDQAVSIGKLVLGVDGQTSIVSGRITDGANHFGLSDVAITLAGQDSHSVATDAEGYFEILAVVPGSYSLSIQKDGFYSLTGSIATVAGQQLVVNQRLIKDGAYLDEGPGDLVATVVDAATNLPLQNVVASLNTGESAVTDDAGRFVFEQLSRASYQATLSLPGYSDINLSILYAAGSDGDLGTFQMHGLDGSVSPSTATIFGTVIDGVNNAPIAGAQIEQIDTGETWDTGTLGEFIAQDLNDLDVQLSISAPGFESRVFALTLSAFGEVAQEFVLPPLNQDGGASTSVISGTVTDRSTGEALSGVQVAIDDASLSVVTDNNGEYQFSDVNLLEFSLQASAIDYVSGQKRVQLGSYGSYQIDFGLDRLSELNSDDIQIVSLAGPQAAVNSNGQIDFAGRIANTTDQPVEVLVIGEVFNANGESVAVISPYAEASELLETLFVFGPEETKDLVIPWIVDQLPAGAYRLMLRVVEPGTISASLPTGIVLTERSATAQIGETYQIAGGFGFNPPLTQAGSQTPVELNALVVNDGNVALEDEVLSLTISDPNTAAVIHTVSTSLNAQEPGQHDLVSFGNWIPVAEGNLDVLVQAENPAVLGSISGQLYVGDKATGTFSLEKHVVPEGTQTVRASIDLEGVDTAAGSSTDPLFIAVKEAIQTGSNYTGNNTLAWQRRSRCMGCHVQTQALVGTASAFQRNLGEKSHAFSLYNAVVGSQQNNGGLSDNQLSRQAPTQTALGIWSLTAWDDLETSFRTLFKAGKYLYDRRSQSGNQTWWNAKFKGGWWRTNESHTAMVVKGFAKILQAEEQIDISQIKDYELTPFTDGLSGSSHRDVEAAPDGYLYTVSSTGHIDRIDPVTSITEEVAVLPINGYGITVDEDGSIYVSGYQKLLRLNTDGTIDTILTASGYLTDVDIGPDGYLYVSDYSNNRILRVSDVAGVEVIASGGLISRPYGLAITAENKIYIANLNNYNLLIIDPSGVVSVFADGLPIRPLYIEPDGAGGFYFTTNQESKNFQTNPGAINHVSAEGLVERIIGATRLFALARTQDGRIFVSNYNNRVLHELSISNLDTSELSNFKTQVDRAANYYLARYLDGTTNNITQAMRLTGLAEARRVTTDPALNAQIDGAITTIADTLRARQRTDGGWGRYTTYGSDPMVTALVGLALDYTNPSVDDPMVRSSIVYLLNNQLGDYSWRSYNGLLSTRLSATSLVVSYLPIALDRLGGIDVDLHLNLPANIELTNATLPADTAELLADGTTAYEWRILGVTGNGRSLAFDLTFENMQLNETRLAANDAYIEFANSFTEELLRVDLDIPSLKTKSETGLYITTDKLSYGEDEDVSIPITVTNTGPTPSDTIVELLVRALDAEQPLAVLASIPVGLLDGGSELNLSSQWNTAATLRGEYEVYGRLLDTAGRELDVSIAPFRIMLAGSVIDSIVTTDKPLYQAWDQVEINARVENITRNAIQAPSIVEITIRNTVGDIVFTGSAQVSELLPGDLRDLPFSFSLVDAQAGVYSVEMVVKDAFSHQTLNITSTTFEVERHAVQSLSGHVEASPVQLYLGDTVQCTESVTNVSGAMLENIEIVSQMINMDTEQVVNEAQRILNLNSGQTEVQSRTLPTDGLPTGAYACVLMATVDGQERVLDVSGFDVLEPPIRIEGELGMGDRGRVLVLLDEVPKQCDGFTRLGFEATLTSPLSETATVTTKLLDQSGVTLDQETGLVDGRLIDDQPGGNGVNLTLEDVAPTHVSFSLNAVTELGAAYQMTVEINEGGVLQTFESGLIATDCSEELVIGQLYEDVHLSDIGRVSAANDPLGANHMPDLDTQRNALETLLSDAGWSYTITTNADDFTRELRTGGYVTYLLLSEHVKLDESVQKELRDAVYRGEGLVEAGGHDQRQGRIDEALGVKFLGKHPDMQGLSVSDVSMGSPASMHYQLVDRTLKAIVEGAVPAGYFINDDATTSDVALTTHGYGQGRSIYAGFDLAAEIAMPDADPSFGKLLLDSLAYVHPDVLTGFAGGAYPLRLALDNLGIATPGQVVMTLPDGIHLLDSGDAAVDGQTLIWPFDLEVGEHWESNAWIQLPDEPVELSALIQSGVSPDLVDQETLSLEITPESLLTVEVVYANVSAITDSEYKQAKKYIEWAHEDSAAGHWDDALSALLRASDALIAIGTEQSEALRVDIARVIRSVAVNL